MIPKEITRSEYVYYLMSILYEEPHDSNEITDFIKECVDVKKAELFLSQLVKDEKNPFFTAQEIKIAIENGTTIIID